MTCADRFWRVWGAARRGRATGDTVAPSDGTGVSTCTSPEGEPGSGDTRAGVGVCAAAL
eukprot:CAMPEP_0177671026 /NCGR_PEP_ID=MMETSP0447-20121125/24439_1 /TAXON_ID=0 /ORGANISM="Stygamoeba regulata, Strain BSH-02190019" /LENGTH=58 /DNA_ID=CAMNT_0019178301 /DNA_START=180 /DNA_END=352 /DNA_ORIENTATION=-